MQRPVGCVGEYRINVITRGPPEDKPTGQDGVGSFHSETLTVQSGVVAPRLVSVQLDHGGVEGGIEPAAPDDD